jgi:elongation factor P
MVGSMTTSNQIAPGMTINIGKNVYRVESSMKVNVTKGTPFIKTKLRNLLNEEVIEKNFKLDQEIKEVTLEERRLEYLYPEGKDYFFLDLDNLELEQIPVAVLGSKINYLKEGVIIKAMFYGISVFSVELPIYLELMVVKTESNAGNLNVSNVTKKALLETGAEVNVPLFIETGDVVKVDTMQEEYIQRV